MYKEALRAVNKYREEVRWGSITSQQADSVKQDILRQYKDALAEGFLIDMISEGVAVYFEHYGRDERTYDFKQWPDTPLNFPNERERIRALYIGGYTLVRPILDIYGKKGLERLIQDSPTSDDFADPWSTKPAF